MKILLKCPTRSRPQKVLQTLKSYIRLAAHPEQLGIAVSCDTSDPSMINVSELQSTISKCAWSQIFYSDNRTKIQACNANMNEIHWDWDIVVLVSDDMIPQIRGYDDVIRNHMLVKFPDRNGILWFNDGAQGDKLNTLCIYGRAFYESQGFIYNPEYKSLFCDTELTDQCRREYKDISAYIPYCIIRHEHPGTGYAQNMDKLYETNQKYWNEDMYTYIRRKKYDYDWSVLIPTIPGREEGLRNLLSSIREKLSRIAPDLRVEYCMRFDNREMSIGMKREELLQGCRGKYMSFIDDDDDITDAYIEDLVQTIRGNYPVMRIRGQINQYTFTHSVENKLSDKMARDGVFLRPPNHLNPMMSDVAKLIHFTDSLRGEDLDWTIRLAKTGFLTNQYTSDPIRIHYIYKMGNRVIDSGTMRNQENMSYETMLQMVWTSNGPALPSQQSVKPVIPVLRLTSRGFVSK
jgi:hypothetical protein